MIGIKSECAHPCLHFGDEIPGVVVAIAYLCNLGEWYRFGLGWCEQLVTEQIQSCEDNTEGEDEDI
jgi:hypothetical protein